MECFHKSILVIFLFVSHAPKSQARAAIWQPSPGHVQVPIWPGAVPDAMPNPKPESSVRLRDANGGPGRTMSADRR